MLLKHIFVIISILISGSEDPQILSSSSGWEFKTSNGCGYAGVVMIDTGGSDGYYPRTIGSIQMAPSGDFMYEVSDTFWNPVQSVEYAIFQGDSHIRHLLIRSDPYFFVGEIYTEEFYWSKTKIIDTFSSTGILKAWINTESEIVLVKRIDSVDFEYALYEYPSWKNLITDTIALQPIKKIRSASNSWRFQFLCKSSLGNFVLAELEKGKSKIVQKGLDSMGTPLNILRSGQYLNSMEYSDSTFAVKQMDIDSGIQTILWSEKTTDFDLVSHWSGYPKVQNSGWIINNSDSSAIYILDESNQIKKVKKLDFRSDEAIYFKGGFNFFPMSFMVHRKGDFNLLFYEDGYPVGLDSFYLAGQPAYLIPDYRCFVGVDVIDELLDLKIYPNPASSDVVIHLGGVPSDAQGVFRVRSASGQLLYETDFYAKESYSLPVDAFPSGLLLFEIEIGQTKLTKKVIKI